MPNPQDWLTQQTSRTNGTGTFVLDPAPLERRSFLAAYGSAQPVAFRARTPGTNLYEVDIGQFDGGSPGTLTRSTVLMSSNAGSLVSFTGIPDIIPVILPGQRPLLGITTSGTEALVDLGAMVLFTGTADATRTLPALANVPRGAGYLYINENGAGAVLTLDGNGSETIRGAATVSIFDGESVELFATAGGWVRSQLPPIGLVRRRVASASATLDFVLPSGFTDFELRFSGLRPSADNTLIALRTSADGGSTFASTASDYEYIAETTNLAGNDVLSAAGVSATAILLTSQIDTTITTNSGQGEFTIWAGDGTRRANVRGEMGHYHNGLSHRVLNRVFGERVSATAINAIRVFPDGGTIAGGTASLYAVR